MYRQIRHYWRHSKDPYALAYPSFVTMSLSVKKPYNAYNVVMLTNQLRFVKSCSALMRMVLSFTNPYRDDTHQGKKKRDRLVFLFFDLFLCVLLSQTENFGSPNCFSFIYRCGRLALIFSFMLNLFLVALSFSCHGVVLGCECFYGDFVL